MNKIQKTTLHPVGDNKTDLYPTTSSDQVVDLVEFLNKQGLNPKPFVVGTVTTLPAGEDAKVTFSESNDKIAINFYIPMGQKGIQGNVGDTGREGPVGPRGPAGNDFQIKLQVNEVSDLPTASSAYLGWAAYVGTSTPRDVWACVEIADGVIAWENQGQLQGPKGDTGNGVDGFTLLSHVVVGDETYNTIQVSYTDNPAETFEVHAKNGENGQNGQDGNKIYTQAVAPTVDDIYNDGDIYIDVSTWNYYSFDNGEWRLDGNIKGAKGDSGVNPMLFEHNITFYKNTQSVKFIASLKIISTNFNSITSFKDLCTLWDGSFRVCHGQCYEIGSNTPYQITKIQTYISPLGLDIFVQYIKDDNPFTLSQLTLQQQSETTTDYTILDNVIRIK